MSKIAYEDSIKEIIKKHDPAFGSIFAFNFLPTRYIDQSWYDDIFPNKSEMQNLKVSFLKSERGHQILNEILLHELDLEEDYCFDFNNYTSRFALMDGKIMSQILFHVGLAYHAKWIVQLVSGHHIKMIIQNIGLDAYNFVTKRVPFFLPWLVSQKTCLPPFDLEKTDLTLACRHMGMQCMILWMQDTPAGLIKRIRLKLPKETLWPITADLEDDPAQIEISFRKIIKEIVPQWGPLFV